LKNVHAFLYLAVIQFALISVLHLARKKFPVSLTREQQNTFIGPFSFVVTVYAFLLSFVVVNLWQTFTEAERTASKEAENVSVLYRLMEPYPGTQDLRDAMARYVDSVVREEWPAMRKGETSPNTKVFLGQVAREFRKLNPVTPRDQAIYAEALSVLDTLLLLRRDRLLTAAGTGSMPEVMWIALAYGGLMVLVGLYFLSVGNQREQTVIDFIVVGILFVTVYLIIQFDSPFQGRLRVTPKAFEAIADVVPPAAK